MFLKGTRPPVCNSGSLKQDARQTLALGRQAKHNMAREWLWVSHNPTALQVRWIMTMLGDAHGQGSSNSMNGRLHHLRNDLKMRGAVLSVCIIVAFAASAFGAVDPKDCEGA